MNYIVFDMEWNQTMSKNHKLLADGTKLTGEIIEIGAVKLNEKMEIAATFKKMIKPQVYTKMHYMVKKITGIDNSTLKNGVSLTDAISEFKSFCGNNSILISWGNDDMTMLKKNLQYFGIDSSWIPKCCNLQTLFTKQTNSKLQQYSVSYAVEYFGITEDKPCHDAMNDAWYTAMIAKKLNLSQNMAQYA